MSAWWRKWEGPCDRRLREPASCGTIPAMTTTVDQRRRAVLPFKPGDVLEIEKQSPGIIVLKRTKAANLPKPRLVRINGELFSAGGGTLSNEEVRSISY